MPAYENAVFNSSDTLDLSPNKTLYAIALFNLGFQLSFMCVFVIITLADRMMHLLNKKCHIPKWVSGSITISLCVTIGTLPLCANTLGTVSLMSVVSNILVIPLFQS